MKKLLVSIGICSLFIAAVGAQAPECDDLRARVLGKPDRVVRIKTRGRPAVFRREQVGRLLDSLGREMAERRLACQWAFAELMDSSRPDAFLVLTDALLRWVPETSLQGIDVFSRDGTKLGRFAAKARYERSGGAGAAGRYTLYYFQFLDSNGKYQTSGHDLSEDRFLVRWVDLKDRNALDSKDVPAGASLY